MRNTLARVRALYRGDPEQTDIGIASPGPDRDEQNVQTKTLRNNMDKFKVAKAMTPFTVDDRSCALQ